MSGGVETFSADTPEAALGNLLEGRPMNGFIPPQSPLGRTVVGATPPSPGFQPKFEWGIANPNVSADPAAQSGSRPWTDAPGTSHIHSWKWDDVREVKFLKKFPGLIGKGRSELHVRFKGPEGQGIAAHYVYYFDDPEHGKAVVDLMAGSPHPFGEVLYPHVIMGENVAYTRVA